MYYCTAKAEGREETTKETEERNYYAKVVYDQNLCMINNIIKKKGIFRISLNHCGEIMLISKTSPGKPPHGTFSLICKGPRKHPEFGSFDALTEIQRAVACNIPPDIVKILNAKEFALVAASKHEPTAELTREVENHLQGLTERFGDLPLSTSDIKNKMDEENQKAIEASLHSIQQELQAVLKNMTPSGKKKSSRSRKKTRNKMSATILIPIPLQRPLPQPPNTMTITKAIMLLMILIPPCVNIINVMLDLCK